MLAHLAGNAEGGSRLLEGVASGVPGWEYRDLEIRAADIEIGSKAPLDVLVARVEATAERFVAACANLSADQWSTPVTWTTGHQNAASEVVVSRLFEVEIHHVDLATGRTVHDWPIGLVTSLFDIVIRAFTGRSDVPSLLIELDDQPDRFVLGAGTAAVGVRGSRADVLTWLLGRTDGRELRVERTDLPPSLPNLY